MRNSRELIFSNAAGKKTVEFPLWMMRQAGRYLPEYMDLRAKHSFLELCRLPELAAEVSMQPLRRFDLDCAIIFSDILLPLCDLDVDVSFPDSGGVQVEMRDIFSGNLSHNANATASAIEVLREKLNSEGRQNIPIIGFCGGPFTLLAFLMGRQSTKIRSAFLSEKNKISDMMARLTDLMIEYLHLQINSGVEVIQVFDTLLGDLSVPDFVEFVKPHLLRIFDAIPPSIVKIFFMKDSLPYIRDLNDIKIDVLSVDWKQPLSNVAHEIYNSESIHIKALQGNLDPAVLEVYGADANNIIHRKTDDLIQEVKNIHKLGFIANLGHGITPQAKISNIEHFINRLRI